MAVARPTTSLVIATYNWPQALECCLLSVLRQRQLPDEIVIADDGSGKATRQLIDEFRSRFTIPLQHIWHEDTGFQLAQIRNKANVAALGDYLIQVDGDLILHPDFVKEHRQAAKPGHFIGGSRVILNQSLSQELIEKKKTSIALFDKGVSNRLNGIHAPRLGAALTRIIQTHNAYNIRGCNMSYWKRDFMNVNGYNEAFRGWGREDTDLVFRFYNSGLQRSFIKLRAIAYHLWHKEADRSQLTTNDEQLQETIRQHLVRCETGASQYLANTNNLS